MSTLSISTSIYLSIYNLSSLFRSTLQEEGLFINFPPKSVLSFPLPCHFRMLFQFIWPTPTRSSFPSDTGSSWGPVGDFMSTLRMSYFISYNIPFPSAFYTNGEVNPVSAPGPQCSDTSGGARNICIWRLNLDFTWRYKVVSYGGRYIVVTPCKIQV